MRHKLILSGLLLIGCQEAGQPATWSDLGPGEPAPVVSSANPTAVSSAGGELLTLKGDNFLKGLSVRVGTVVSRDIVLRSSQEIAVRVPTQLGVRGPVDVVVTNPRGSSGVGAGMVTYYPGAVGFGANQDQPGGVAPVGFALLDLRGTRKLDLVGVFAARGVKTPGSAISVLTAGANGAFQFSADYPLGGMGVSSMAVGDVSGDGKADVAVVNTPTNTVSVSLGAPDGDGYRFAAKQDVPVGSGPISLIMADANKDNKQDLVVANYDSATLTVLTAVGDGKFSSQTIRLGTPPFALASGDLDGDGKVDLAFTSVRHTVVGVLFGDGAGGFALSTNEYQTGSQPQALAIADVNGDNLPDILVANRGSNNLSVYLNKGDKTFTYLGAPYLGSAPVGVSVADLNGDGRADVVAPCYDGQNVGVLIGMGDGYFKPSSLYNAGPYSSALAVGDVNNDHMPDLVVGNGNGTLSVLLNQSQ